VSSLFKTYGRVLAGFFVALTAIWVVAFIVLPQLTVLQRAFIYVDQGGKLAQIGNDIDRIYSELSVIEFDIGAIQNVESAAPAVVSGPSFGMSMGSGIAKLSASERAMKLEKWKLRKADLIQKVKNMERQEQSLKEAKADGPKYSLKNFTSMSKLHLKIFLWTLIYALCVTVLAFFACYPVAYAVSQASTPERGAFMMLGLIVPYTINELLRIFAWTLILSKGGVANGVLGYFGFIDLSVDGGIRFLASNGAVFTVMVYTYILFMVFPIYNTITTLDKNLIEAARDLGSPSWRIHWRVILPHAKPGIAVGCVMTFMLSIGSIAVPEIVGRGLHPDWFSQVIYRRFFESNNWNQGSAYSLVLLLACIIFIFIIMRLFKVSIREVSR